MLQEHEAEYRWQSCPCLISYSLTNLQTSLALLFIYLNSVVKNVRLPNESLEEKVVLL